MQHYVVPSEYYVGALNIDCPIWETINASHGSDTHHYLC